MYKICIQKTRKCRILLTLKKRNLSCTSILLVFLLFLSAMYSSDTSSYPLSYAAECLYSWGVQCVLSTTVNRMLLFINVDGHIIIITVIFIIMITGVDGPVMSLRSQDVIQGAF